MALALGLTMLMLMLMREFDLSVAGMMGLGGLLTFSGIAYVITGNQTIAFDKMDVALAINAPLLGIISVRALVVLALFIVAALVIAIRASAATSSPPAATGRRALLQA